MKAWSTIIRKSETILSHVFKEDSSFLLFHDDADGCCAASILLNLVSRRNAHGVLDYASPEKHSVELTPKLAERLKKKQPRFLLSLDLAFTSSVKKIESLLRSLGARMLIYDHHVPSKSLQWPEGCIHINPLNFGLGNMPASYYSYILHRHYTGNEASSWVAAVGVVADYRAKECVDLLEEVRRRYPSLYPFETIDQSTALRSPLMTLAHLVNAGYQHSDYQGAKMAVEVLNEALQTGDPTVLLEGKTRKAELLHKFREEVDAELRKYLEESDSRAEFHLGRRLVFYFIKPRFNITSQVATELEHRLPNAVVAVISPETLETIKISLRRGNQADVDLAALAESTTTGLAQASAGGHRDAAGCVLLKKDVTLWKENIVQYLSRHC